MSGRVPSSYGSWSGTGTDKRWQAWHVVCQRLRRVHLFLLRGCVGNDVFWAFWLLFGALCIWGVLAWLVYNLWWAWVTSVCLLLDTPFGWRSLGALSS